MKCQLWRYEKLSMKRGKSFKLIRNKYPWAGCWRNLFTFYVFTWNPILHSVEDICRLSYSLKEHLISPKKNSRDRKWFFVFSVNPLVYLNHLLALGEHKLSYSPSFSENCVFDSLFLSILSPLKFISKWFYLFMVQKGREPGTFEYFCLFCSVVQVFVLFK